MLLFWRHNIDKTLEFIYLHIMTLKSLTVFDPKKVFTEVIKSCPYCNAVGEDTLTHKYGDTVTIFWDVLTHKVFLHPELFMHVPLKSRANGTRIKDTSVDRFTGRVSKKKKIMFLS